MQAATPARCHSAVLVLILLVVAAEMAERVVCLVIEHIDGHVLVC